MKREDIMKEPVFIEKISEALTAAKIISNGISNGTIDFDTYVEQDRKILEAIDYLVKEGEYSLTLDVIEKIMDMMEVVIEKDIHMTFSAEEVKKIMNNFFYLYVWLGEMLDEIRKKEIGE